MSKEELIQYLNGFVDYCQRLPLADEFNVTMIETVLSNFAKWLEIQV